MLYRSGATRQQIDDLLRYYLFEKQRPEAAARLLEDIEEARRRIVARPDSGLAHPRPYPELSAFGFRWMRVRAYWFAWTRREDAVILTNVFHGSADITGRAVPLVEDIADW